MTILTFAPQYHFLSNAYPAPVWLDQVLYRDIDRAYQASKTTDPETRRWIHDAPTPRQVWWRGRTVKLPDDWETRRLDVMAGLLAQKFTHHLVLKARLLATVEACLVYESRRCCDRFWGTCDGEGENHLGVLLMTLRTTLRRGDEFAAWKEAMDGPAPARVARTRKTRDPLAS